VVIDASIGNNPTGLRLAMSIKAALPYVGIVVLVDRQELAALAQSPKRQSPRCSFLLKDSILDSVTFAKVIEGAAAGLVAIDPLIVRALQNPYRQLLERLTFEQLIALELLAAGFSDLVIAEKLSMTRRQATLLVRSVYADLHISRDPSVHRRVKAALVFLTETSGLHP
jgi:DNA-binding NarL/FixJ family response regulator